MKFNYENFQNPPAEYRTLPFWSWNETLEPQEIKRQVRLFKEAGLGGGFLHARVGLLTHYLGEEWFMACCAAVDQLRESGLKAWLYDEDSWPSGFSGGGVPLADETYRHKALFARPVGVPVPENSVPVGEAVDGLQIYCWTASLGEARFNGTCYADLMSAEAMREFIGQAYDSYFHHLGPHYSETVVAEFTDEPCALLHYRIPAGAVPFTPSLFETFETLHGYDPRPHLHLLFTESPDAPRFRLHYYRVVSHLFEHNFTKQLADWCEAHGIALTGHYYREDSLFEQQAAGNAIMPNFRHQQIPGIDHLFLQATEIVTAKQCQSVVNQYSKPRMMCEMYAGCGQNMTFEDRLWIACHLMVMGVNMVTSHLCLYSMSGSRKRDYPPNLSYQQPWFEVNEAIDLPLARLCAALSQGKYVADVLLLHPLDSIAALWCARTDWPEPDSLNGSSQVTSADVKAQIQKIEADFDGVMRTLLEAQRGFDLGDNTILSRLARCAAVDGQTRFCVGAMEYPVVVLPSLVTLSEPVFGLLQQFAAEGGIILRCGDAPSLLDGDFSEELQEFIARLPFVPVNNLSGALADLHEASIQISPNNARPMVRSHVRDLPDGDRLVFLFDLRRTGEAAIVECQCLGDYELIHRLDPFTGTESVLKCGTGLQLSFSPTEFHLLRLSRGKVPSALSPDKHSHPGIPSTQSITIPPEGVDSYTAGRQCPATGYGVLAGGRASPTLPRIPSQLLLTAAPQRSAL
jgi:hypothetical protein